MKRPWDSIRWWELRRIPFNAVLAVAGVTTIVVIEVIGSHYANPGEDVEEPLGLLVGGVLYGVGANVAYTLGWVTELLWSWGDTAKTEALRRRIFWLGLIASTVLTLLPALLVPAAWAIFGFQHGP